MTRLIIPIAASNIDEAEAQINAAKKAGAQMIELRLDYIRNLDTEITVALIDLVKSEPKSLPVVVTCRCSKQGGAIAYQEPFRIEILTEAIKAGADYIDCEYDSFVNLGNQEKIRLALASSIKTRLILSAHEFNGPFNNLAGIYRHIQATYPAAIPKLVYTANHINDCFPALDLLARTSDERIIFCMGEAGLITRVIAKKFNCYYTFASLTKDTSTAPGQLTVNDFKNLYRFNEIDEKTELYGIIGYPVGHSLSPAVHNACFDAMSLNKLYLPILLEGGQAQFDAFINNLNSRKYLNFKAFSVTIPHKQNCLSYVQRKNGKVEPLSEIIGSANTFKFGPDELVSAFNTDYTGALDAITKAGPKDLHGTKAAVIGAGGVARAVVAGLISVGAEVTIYNRTVKKAQKLAEEFNCEFAPLKELENIDAKLIVNCTSLGMTPNIETTPLPSELITKDMIVFDTVYSPPKTQLLKDAKAVKAKTISGLDMFISQAAAQFKIFTKQDADTKLMKKIVTKAL